MEAVDSSVINTAIPAMSQSFHVEPVDIKMALISYLLSLAIFIPISGWIADKMGAKKVFISALVIFTLSSLWCGLSNHLNELIIARFIQGLGGALGLPVGRLILIRTFGRENLINTMNQVVTVGALGMMLGPVIGGFITYHFSWHWIFLVNIPVGLLCVSLAYYYFDAAAPKKVPPLDKVGMIFFGAGLAGLTYGLSVLSETNVSLVTPFTVLLMSIIMLIVYALHSRKQANPIVNTQLLRLRTFRVSFAGNLLSRLGFGSVPFLVPLLLQICLGLSAQLSGLLLAPTAAGVLVAKRFSLALLRHLGYKALLVINTCFAGLSIGSFALISTHTSIYIISILIFIYGFVMSLQYSAMNSLAYADIAPDDLSAATSIMGTLQQLAQSFGVAVSAIFIRLFTLFFPKSAQLTPIVFHYTFFMIGIITVISTFIFMQLTHEDGQHMLL